MGTIFQVHDDGLIEMEESGYALEADLQELLARYPKLLAGDQINSAAPRRWLLVKRELGLPSEEGGSDHWSVDHLFLDQDAVPTIVEVKRSSNTEIRRTIVGQMLDYAASAVVYWPVERIQTDFEGRCEKQSLDPEVELEALIGDRSPKDFWKQVKTNLQAGRVRMLFVADVIPDELRRIVEFMNEQMDPAEVLAVEVRRFASDTVQTLVPRVIGNSAQAQTRKGGQGGFHWDEAKFMAALKTNRGEQGVAVARRFLEWSKDKFPRLWWGHGAKIGSVYPCLDRGGKEYYPASLRTTGLVKLSMRYMAKRSPFDDEGLRLEFFEKINRIPGVELPAEAIDGVPDISFEFLETGNGLDLLLEALDWFVAQIPEEK